MDLGFKALVIFILIQRIFELFIAKRNEKHILSKGGHIVQENNYVFMVLLHSIWILTMLYFAYLTPLNLSPLWFFIGFTLLIMGQVLRINAIVTLKERWSTRIVILPNAEIIKDGLYRWMKHPNYLGVIFEISALPLMAGLFKLSFIFGLCNLIILYFRVKLEEQSLSKYNNYQTVFLSNHEKL